MSDRERPLQDGHTEAPTEGGSTCAQALTYHHMRKHENLSGSLMGDIAGTSDKVFEIYRRYAENDEFPWDDTGTNLADNGNLADLIKLNTGSAYGKETAGSKNAGRSGTIQVGNMTETAFWTTTGRGDLLWLTYSPYMTVITCL